MKKTAVEWYNDEEMSLRQAVTNGIEFSFLSKNNKQVSPFAYCKDYLQDVVHGFLTNKKKSIYGFTYDPKKHQPISITTTKLLVTNFQDPYFSSKIPNCLDFLNQIELELKMTKTSALKADEPPMRYTRCGVWIFQGSRRWLKSPPMISLYTLLIRIGFGHTIGTPFKDTIAEILADKKTPYQPVDRWRLSEAMDGINAILTAGDRKIFHRKIQDNYPDKIAVKIMHDNLGIVGFSCGSTKKYMDWRYQEKI